MLENHPDEDRDDAATGATLAKSLAGDGFAAKLDALFHRHFHGTAMGNDTALWNQCAGFRADVAALYAELHPSA